MPIPNDIVWGIIFIILKLKTELNGTHRNRGIMMGGMKKTKLTPARKTQNAHTHTERGIIAQKIIIFYKIV